MPGWLCNYHGPEYYAKLRTARKTIAAELVAKGLVEGHGKFDAVLGRKLRKRGF